MRFSEKTAKTLGSGIVAVGCLFYAAWMLFVVACAGGIAYAAWHFICKYW